MPVGVVGQQVGGSQLLGGDEHRRIEPNTDVVQPSLELVRRETTVARQDRRDQVARLDDALGRVAPPGELGQLRLDAVHECVDVRRQGPGHGPQDTRGRAADSD